MKKIKFSRKVIQEFRKMGIEIIFLFGSEAQNLSSKLSDIDIGIVFQKPEKIKNTLPLYKELYRIFSKIFIEKKEIDIVFLQFTPISLQLAAAFGGKVLYQKSKKKVYPYKEKILRKYLDFLPHLKKFNEAILARI